MSPRALARDAGMSSGQARLLKALRAEAARYVRALHAARSGRPRDIHALRIATRRMLALMEFGAALAPSDKWRARVREIRQPFRKCARLRDLQATRAHLDQLRNGKPARQALLRALQKWLREAIRRRRRRTIEQLEAVRPRRVCRKIIQLASARTGSARSADGAGDCIDRSRREVRGACRRMCAGGVEALHRARVAIKRCRYELEMAAAVGAAAQPGQLRALRRLQQALGTVTDLELLRGELKRYARQHRGQKRALAQLRRELGRERAQRRAEALAMVARGAIVVSRN
ncbi:MAG: CHAD domain-containing protein [Proteobacteria bacterium]|nr:CHAD domain-containing protein [Pseudomonadota bacterium]